MRTIILREHSERCRCSKDVSKPWTMFCELNPHKDVFFFNGEFIFIEIPSCIKNYERDFDLVLNIIENSRKEDSVWEVSKSNRLEQHLKDHRLRGIELKTFLSEINYIYHGAAKSFCIATDRPISQVLYNNDLLRDEFIKIRDYLEETRNFGLIKTASELLRFNHIEVSEKEIAMSVKELSKLLTQKTK